MSGIVRRTLPVTGTLAVGGFSIWQLGLVAVVVGVVLVAAVGIRVGFRRRKAVGQP